jgi:hypothetical protein
MRDQHENTTPTEAIPPDLIITPGRAIDTGTVIHAGMEQAAIDMAAGAPRSRGERDNPYPEDLELSLAWETGYEQYVQIVLDREAELVHELCLGLEAGTSGFEGALRAARDMRSTGYWGEGRRGNPHQEDPELAKAWDAGYEQFKNAADEATEVTGDGRISGGPELQ